MATKLILFIALLFPFFSYAEKPPKDFPNKLLYANQPIDPLCFEQKENTSLKNCGISTNREDKITGHNQKLLNEGFVGFDYVWSDTKNPSYQAQSYSYYKAFPLQNDTYLIYSVYSGGGSGSFSALHIVKRTGDDLKINTLTVGDRCNGGIENVKLKNKIFSYDVNITPFDFLTIANDNPHQLQAYDALAACAACCAGTASYERPQDFANGEEKLISAHLNSSPEDITGMSQGTYQACFNQIYIQYKKSGKDVLNSQELKKFTQLFNQQCVKKG